VLRQQAVGADRGGVGRSGALGHPVGDAGLVRDVQVGTRRIYSLDPDGLARLRDYLDRFWNTALHSFKTRVERPDQQEETP